MLVIKATNHIRKSHQGLNLHAWWPSGFVRPTLSSPPLPDHAKSKYRSDLEFLLIDQRLPLVRPPYFDSNSTKQSNRASNPVQRALLYITSWLTTEFYEAHTSKTLPPASETIQSGMLTSEDIKVALQRVMTNIEHMWAKKWCCLKASW